MNRPMWLFRPLPIRRPTAKNAAEIPGIRAKTHPDPRGGGAGWFEIKNYLEDFIIIGAGAGAADGQHEAASNEVAAAMMASLAIFILVES